MPFINYINIFWPHLFRLSALLFFSLSQDRTNAKFQESHGRKIADIQGENMEWKKKKIWTLVASSARPSISLLVYLSLLAVLLFSNHILVFLAPTFVLLSSFE